MIRESFRCAENLHDYIVRQFGKPEAIYFPSPKQTLMELIEVLGIEVIGFYTILSDDYSSVNKTFVRLIFGVIIIFLGIRLGYWFWRARKWRFYICPRGVVEIGAFKVQALHWHEIIEVLEIRDWTPWPLNGKLLGVKLIGHKSEIEIYSNFLLRPELQTLERILEASRRKSVPIRIKLLERES
jgi:hypothetical protein